MNRWPSTAASFSSSGGLLGRDDRRTTHDAEIIDAWQQGRTGMPFIDANMRGGK